MLRAVGLPVDDALRPMRGAHGLAAARALQYLVHAHGLVGSAFALPQACRAQTPASLGRVAVALLRMPVAHHPAAARARGEARRAGGVTVLGADSRMGRAMLEATRWAHPDVLVARGLTVHATLDDAVLRTEVLCTHRAAVRAGLTAAVVVPAHDERRRRCAAVWAGHHPAFPRGGRAQRPLRAEGRAPASRGLEPPLDALDEHARFDELQRMHHRSHLAAPDLLGAAPFGGRRSEEHT